MAEHNSRWQNEHSSAKGTTLSTSTSSFEALDPHDPNLSRLATSLFQKTSDYLFGEITTTQDYYMLLEKLNTTAITKYSDMKQMASNIGKTAEEQNAHYRDVLKPLFLEIDELEEKVAKFEEQAYQIDNFTKQLVLKFKNVEKGALRF